MTNAIDQYKTAGKAQISDVARAAKNFAGTQEMVDHY